MWPLCINALSACAAVAVFFYVVYGETLSEYTCCKAIPPNRNWTRCATDFYERNQIDTYHLYTAPRIFLGLIWTAAAATPYTHAVYNTHILIDRHDPGSSVYGLFMTIICILYILAMVFTLGSIDILHTTYCYTNAWHNALHLYADIGVWAINIIPAIFAFVITIVHLGMWLFRPTRMVSFFYTFYFPRVAQQRSTHAYTPPPE